MKKLTILVSEKHIGPALNRLQKIGVVHVKYVQKPHADLITSLERKLGLLDEAVSFLDDSTKQKKDTPQLVLISVIKETLTLKQEKECLSQRIKALEECLFLSNRLGHASLTDLNRLKEAGLFIKLYRSDRRSLKCIPETKIAQAIFQKGKEVYLALVATSEEDGLDLAEVSIPHESTQSLGRKIHNCKKELIRNQGQLKELSTYRHCLSAHKKELVKRLEFGKVRFGSGFKGGISYLEGFCPNDLVAKIEQAATQQGWAVAVSEPETLAEVPTLIKNPRWVEIIRPIFKFMGTLPGYEEHDISFWFLLFFSIFFAMLIGDAGYGLLFLATTFFVRKKLPKLPREPFFLMYVLSSATVVWGSITGTWFGVEAIARWPILNSLVISEVNSFISSNQGFMIQLCFVIGAIHLSIAHGIVAFRYMNSPLALAQLGWISIIWTAFFVAGKLVLGKIIPAFTLPLGLLGAILVVVFSNFQRNIFKGVLKSLGDFPLKVISSFSDVVSYLRLFAVGYATVVLAVTFNKMAQATGFDTIVGGLSAASILFLGHSLNIILGFMAVIVHGIRLNMLEFSSHLNMEWTGVEYKPFKR